jgi:EmrB/QacA subfamily drug resistance transporter
MIGIVIFLIGSALSGLSQNMGMLILFRGIQGIGAGSLFPVALAVIGDLFTPQERGKYQGLFGAVFGIAFVAGPLIGGWLTENVGWHWIFYVNIPIGIVALAVIQRLLPTVKTPTATRNFDILGGVIFTIAMVFLLVGLTNKGLTNATTHALNDWTEPTVGGFILIGIIGTLLFLVAEARAKEPIIPLGLWRSRTYSASMVSTFFAAFAFFGAIVFLPRWFQVVEGFSPTNSGLAALPLMVGLIGSSIVSGLLVSRTGRYKWLLVGSIAVMGFATLLMTQLTKDTPVPVVWLWMFIAGLGVGPTFSVFTIVIQNAVPFRQLGVATSNLTFFRQIGGTIALAFVGTIFGTAFKEQLVPQLSAAGVPQPVIDGFQQASAGGGVDLGQLTGVGDMGAAILAAIPPQFQEAIKPVIPAMVEGIHGAFSLATAQTFWLGVFGSIIAVGAAIAIKEIPLRATNEAPVPVRAAGSGTGAAQTGASRPAPTVD